MVNCSCSEDDVCDLPENCKFCYVNRLKHNGEIQIFQGCLKSDVHCGYGPKNDEVIMCCSENNCNNASLIERLMKKYPLTVAQESPDLHLIYFSSAAFMSFFVILFVLLAVVNLKKHHKCRSDNEHAVLYSRSNWKLKGNTNKFLKKFVATDSTKLSIASDGIESSSVIPTQQTYVDLSSRNAECGTSSGSGRGNILLIPQTISRTVHLSEVIGRGRYGEVWKGELNGENVAVKIFPSREEYSWQKEAYVFNETHLSHDAIVTFFAADIYGRGAATEMWLIMSYYSNGSLFDHLIENDINTKTLLCFASSAARGLHYLHTSIGQKPAIAHRDLKSKNLLIKDDFTLCIADFGLAAIEGIDSVKHCTESKVGTRRYLPPEILSILRNDSTAGIMAEEFSFLLQGDIYSFGLALWEMITCLKLDSRFNDQSMTTHHFFPPYYDMIPPDPTVEELATLVVDSEVRPLLPVKLSFLFNKNSNSSDVNMPSSEKSYIFMIRQLWKLICESWSDVPSYRPSALLLKKSLRNLETEYLTFDI